MLVANSYFPPNTIAGRSTKTVGDAHGRASGYAPARRANTPPSPATYKVFTILLSHVRASNDKESGC